MNRSEMLLAPAYRADVNRTVSADHPGRGMKIRFVVSDLKEGRSCRMIIQERVGFRYENIHHGRIMNQPGHDVLEIEIPCRPWRMVVEQSGDCAYHVEYKQEL